MFGLMLVFLIAATGETTSIMAIIAIVSGLITAITAFFSVRVNRRQAHAAETTAEGNAIKAIAEANEIALRNLREEIDRLSTVVNRLNTRLNQERQWVVRLIRALNQAGVEIPARPEYQVGVDVDTDETVSLAFERQESKAPTSPTHLPG